MTKTPADSAAAPPLPLDQRMHHLATDLMEVMNKHRSGLMQTIEADARFPDKSAIHCAAVVAAMATVYISEAVEMLDGNGAVTAASLGAARGYWLDNYDMTARQAQADGSIPFVRVMTQ